MSSFESNSFGLPNVFYCIPTIPHWLRTRITNEPSSVEVVDDVLQYTAARRTNELSYESMSSWDQLLPVKISASSTLGFSASAIIMHGTFPRMPFACHGPAASTRFDTANKRYSPGRRMLHCERLCHVGSVKFDWYKYYY